MFQSECHVAILKCYMIHKSKEEKRFCPDLLGLWSCEWHQCQTAKKGSNVFWAARFSLNYSGINRWHCSLYLFSVWAMEQNRLSKKQMILFLYRKSKFRQGLEELFHQIETCNVIPNPVQFLDNSFFVFEYDSYGPSGYTLLTCFTYHCFCFLKVLWSDFAKHMSILIWSYVICNFLNHSRKKDMFMCYTDLILQKET